MKIVYFSWVRERIGREEEQVDVPAEVTTAGELIAWLATRGPEYRHALEHATSVRVALDHTHVRPDAPLKGASEAALFPPMTGG